MRYGNHLLVKQLHNHHKHAVDNLRVWRLFETRNSNPQEREDDLFAPPTQTDWGT